MATLSRGSISKDRFRTTGFHPVPSWKEAGSVLTQSSGWVPPPLSSMAVPESNMLNSLPHRHLRGFTTRLQYWILRRRDRVRQASSFRLSLRRSGFDFFHPAAYFQGTIIAVARYTAVWARPVPPPSSPSTNPLHSPPTRLQRHAPS